MINASIESGKNYCSDLYNKIPLTPHKPLLDNDDQTHHHQNVFNSHHKLPSFRYNSHTSSI